MAYMNLQIYRWRLLMLVAPVFILLSGCANTGQPQITSEKELLVPVTDTPTNIYHPGKFVWHDLLTPDLDISMKFYGGLFNWDFKRTGRYVIIFNKGHKIGGIVGIRPGQKKILQSPNVRALNLPEEGQGPRAISVAQGQGRVRGQPAPLPGQCQGGAVNS